MTRYRAAEALWVRLCEIEVKVKVDYDKEVAHSAADDAVREFLRATGQERSAQLHKQLAAWCA